jgi:hypothetical protein
MHVLAMRYVTYNTWKGMYELDPSLKDIWVELQQPKTINQTPFLYYNVWEGWIYHLNQLCIP